MSSSSPPPRRDDPIPLPSRPLPGAPSLEYERKEAKALLKSIHAGDTDALRRVQLTHPVALRDRRTDELQLADAQHVIAREYGFTSWVWLVDYFKELERHCSAPRYNSGDVDAVDALERLARRVIRQHHSGDPIVARELAHFVPRFYGRPASEVLATPIIEDEAQLVVARRRRRASWEELLERASASRTWRDRRTWEGNRTPLALARRAIRGHDLDSLTAILDDHPELLTPSVIDREWRTTLVSLALTVECDAGTHEARRVTDLLASRGADVQRELDERLLGMPQDGEKRFERIRWYLERGANPRWMPPNGFTVLEHAIVRYGDAASVDLIAERTTPRRALWIAAGLGDVAGVRRFIAGKGTLTPTGRQNRPDLVAMASFPPALPLDPAADDIEIMWEAFRVAAWNGRWETMDALLDAGLTVDHAPWGSSLVLEAVGSMVVPLAEYLVSRGADLDRDWPPHGSARSLAREHIRNNPQSGDARRLLRICGAGPADQILAEQDATRSAPPPFDERTLRVMQLAADDAGRQGQSTVTTENLLVGLLRVSGGIFAEIFLGTGTDMPKLRAAIGSRLLPDMDPLVGQQLVRGGAAEAAVQIATAEADARRRAVVHPLHLLKGILSQRTAPGWRMLAEAGLSEALLMERLVEL